jgi:excisionase family DNA binding protein
MQSIDRLFSLSVDEVCEATSLGRTTIYSALRNGALKSRKVGKRTIILIEDLKNWLNVDCDTSDKCTGGTNV